MICIYDKGSFIILATFNFSFIIKVFHIFKWSHDTSSTSEFRKWSSYFVIFRKIQFFQRTKIRSKNFLHFVEIFVIEPEKIHFRDPFVQTQTGRGRKNRLDARCHLRQSHEARQISVVTARGASCANSRTQTTRPRRGKKTHDSLLRLLPFSNWLASLPNDFRPMIFSMIFHHDSSNCLILENL